MSHHERHQDVRGRYIAAFALPFGALVVIGIILFLVSRILLVVDVDVAPFVAIAMAALVLGVCALVANARKFTAQQLMPLAGIFAVALVAGGIASWFIGERHIAPHLPGFVVHVSALNIEFDTDEIRVPADEEFVIEFENLDAGIPHNVAIYTDDTLEEALFVGEIFNGVETREYEVEPLAAGQYYFHCDVHPNMNGTVIAEEGAGGVPGVADIAAMNNTFQPNTLTLPAEQEVTIRFDNQDTVPHNIAIFTDESRAEVVFRGDIFTGPAVEEYVFEAPAPGEYFFHCDVHPEMQGTITFQEAGGGPEPES